MSKPPFILFVPSYGNGGTGEFVRCVTLAETVARRWPQVRIEFLLPGWPGTRQDAPFPYTCHPVPGPSKGRFNNAQILRLKPDLVIFDSALPGLTQRLCWRLGIPTVLISGQAVACGKAFRLDRLLMLDEHWAQRDHVTAPFFTPWQRFLARLSKTRRVTFDTCLPQTPGSDEDLPAEVARRLSAPFVVLSPGGGGFRIDGRLTGDIFLEAAEAIHAASGIECLTLLGPLHEGKVGDIRTMAMKEVSPGRFIDLMTRAAVVVSNGGFSVSQAVACGAACVAAPLNDTDQPGRIAAFAEAGLLKASRPVAAEIAAAALALLVPAENAAQRQRVQDQKIVNGIPVMCDAIARLLPALG